MANRGIAPADPTTTLGQLRFLISDTSYVPLVPPEVGYGDYALFSDDELNALLAQSGDSVKRAAYLAYTKLYAFYTSQALIVQTDDLKVDATKRANAFLELAKLFRDDADGDDSALDGEFFDIVPLRFARPIVPEATPRPWHRFV